MCTNRQEPFHTQFAGLPAKELERQADDAFRNAEFWETRWIALEQEIIRREREFEEQPGSLDNGSSGEPPAQES